MFEIITDTPDGGELTVCGGGRYDGLVEELGGPATPGIGWGMGIERMLMVQDMRGTAPAAPDYLDAFVVALGDAARLEGVRLVRELREKGLKVAEGAKKRGLMLTTACGPSRFDYADKAKNDAEVAKFMPILEILGEMKSVGLIICPARGRPEVGLKELRADFVENTGKRLAEKAAACGTDIVLEPLRRGETPFLRQVADGAKMAQEIGKGCKVMGDFWHMRWEEPNFFAAFVAAGPLLAHVHIASLATRKIPGSDGAADNYVDGFKGLKFIGYRGAVSVEAGFKEIGRNEKNKPIYPDNAGKRDILVKMSAMLRRQWE